MIAVGFRFYKGTGKVTYVDPNSDLYGKVNIGDEYVSLSIGPGSQSTDTNTAAIVYLVFRQKGVLHSYPTRQKPIDSFSQDMADKFKNGWGSF